MPFLRAANRELEPFEERLRRQRTLNVADATGRDRLFQLSPDSNDVPLETAHLSGAGEEGHPRLQKRSDNRNSSRRDRGQGRRDVLDGIHPAIVHHGSLETTHAPHIGLGPIARQRPWAS